MPLFASLLTCFKNATSTPAPLSTYPSTSSHATSADAESDWEIIALDETTVFNTDRITVFLGPPMRQHHHIPLTKIPKSSSLLTWRAAGDPTQRYIRTAGLDVPMISEYLEAITRSPDALAIEASWLNLFKLAITAEELCDARTEVKALSVLRKKGIMALAPGSSLGLFDAHDYAFVHEYYIKFSRAQNLMRVLCEVGSLDAERSGLPTPQRDYSRWRFATVMLEVARNIGALAKGCKLDHPVLKTMDLRLGNDRVLAEWTL